MERVMTNNVQSTVLAQGDLASRFAHVYATHPLNTLIKNAHARTQLLSLDGVVMPTTLVDDVRANCYVVSPHAAIVDYGQDECDKLPPHQGTLLRHGLHALSTSLKLTYIDQVATLNNYCLSTNTLGQAFLTLDKRRLTDFAVSHFPRHAILIRSLNEQHHPAHLHTLKKLGYHLITSRQVYLFDDFSTCHHHQNYWRDQKLLTDGNCYFKPCQSDDDYQQAEHWYNRLYLDKYSRQNVQFTAKGLQIFHQQKILDLMLLMDKTSNQSCGVLGMVTDDSEITAPIVGYDIAAKKSLGLYRRIIAQALNNAQASGKRLNLSSGAPSFKMLRGGKPCIEYTAVYTKHLPIRQRLPWLSFAKLSPSYAKLLQHYQL